MQDTTTNPYESPQLAAEEQSVIFVDRSRMVHIFVVAVGAIIGGIVMFSVPYMLWSSGSRVGSGSLAKVAMAGIPVGAVVGGLFAKWCALQFRPVPESLQR